MFNKKTILLVITAVGLSAFALGCGEQEQAERIRPIRVVTVGDATELTNRSLPGQSEAFQEVDLSFRVGGPVVERPVSRGDEVKRGDLIARIDPRDFDVQVRNLEADLKTAQADSEFESIQYERLKDLLSREAANQKEVDEAKAKRDAAVGRTASVQAQLDHALDELSYTELKAPYDGVVAETYVDAFTTVKSQQQIVRFLDTTRIKFTIDIPEHAITNVQYVTDIEVTFDTMPDTPIPATIKEIAPQASERTRTYPVTLLLDPPEGVTIIPGMTGEVRAKANLPEEVGSEGIEIPVTAILEAEDGNQYVWLVGEDKTVTRKQVQVGDLTSRGIKVSGIEPGQVIATAGVHYLKEGQEVRVESAPIGGDT